MNILFLCSQNRLRSPTAEQIFADYAGINVYSAGLDHTAINPLSADLLEWADIIFVMEPSHRKKLQKKFKPWLKDQSIISLGIPDDYEFMDPTLIDILKTKVSPYLP